MSLLYGVHRLDGQLDTAGAMRLVSAMGLKAATSRAVSVCSFHRSEKALQGGPTWGVWGRPLMAALPGAGHGAAGPNVHLIGQCRLDNRADLLRVIHAAADDLRPDVELIADAYARFGADCVAHLVGDWAFALWDADRQRLLLARDATGNSALFWWQGGGQLLFATGLQTLLAAGPVPRQPNPRWIAGLLNVFYDPAEPTCTAFESVHTLPPGHLLLAHSGQVGVKRWWHPEELSRLDDTPLPELAGRFSALYDDAVRQRLRSGGGPVAATLSGGLDSGTVVALAAGALAEQGQLLPAYVHVPRFDVDAHDPRRISNEWSLAQSTARHVGNVKTIACATDQISPLDAIWQWLDIAAAPSHAAGNWYWLLDITQQASSAGSQVLLTGAGGNTTVSYKGSGELLTHLGAMRLASVHRELINDDAGWRGAVKHRLLKPMLRPAWQRLRQAFDRSRQVGGWTGHSLLNPAYALELGLVEAQRRAGHDPSFSRISAQLDAQWRLGLRPGIDARIGTWAEVCGAFGIELLDPTRDQRLVELCWRLPDELFWFHGRQRGLIRSAMRELLPKEVLNCTGKGIQSADLAARLRDCRRDLLAELDRVAGHPLVQAWIDVPRLVSSVQAVLDGSRRQPTGAVDAANLLRSLSAAIFIARQD